MKTKSFNLSIKLGLSVLVSSACLNAADINPQEIIEAKCTACHTNYKDTSDTSLTRISEQRKTPEGWWMTISRMEKSNGLVISNEEKKSVVKYLSDTQGLNPEESEPYRYILEKQPNMIEAKHDELFTQMCNRCHSAARVGLQRRTKTEWQNLVEFHMSYFPSIEYHALSRDRDWYKVAKSEIIDYLDKNLNNDKEFKMVNADYSGEWIVFGHRLGEGDYTASLKLTQESKDNYKVELKGNYLDGRELSGSGKAIVYSGYEYRAILEINGIDFKQVLMLDPKNLELKGAMHELKHSEETATLTGVKVTNKDTKVLGVYPKAIKEGTNQTITIVGNNLNKNIKLSSGLKLNKVLESTSTKVVLSVSASENIEKQIDLTIGSLKVDDSFVVYKNIEGLKVLPTYAIARVGDAGGPLAKQHSIFEAHGVLSGADGKVGTEDDISLGVVDAKWSIEPFDDISKHDNDIKFVGTMDSASGRFIPSFAGPNPLRKFGTNNAGNMKVIATYNEDNKVVKGDSHMMVTIQKWINTPID